MTKRVLTDRKVGDARGVWAGTSPQACPQAARIIATSGKMLPLGRLFGGGKTAAQVLGKFSANHEPGRVRLAKQDR